MEIGRDMIDKKILDKISELLKKESIKFLNLKLMEDELNIDVHIKKMTIKIIKSHLKEINEYLCQYDMEIVKLLTKEQYYRKSNKRHNEDNISKFCDLVMVYKEKGIFKEDELELKKTNNNVIPGSSINQIKPDKALLFFKYSKKKVDIESGYYFQTVEERIPFPDRSPRPSVSFKSLEATNKELKEGNYTLEEVKKRNVNVFSENWIDQIVFKLAR